MSWLWGLMQGQRSLGSMTCSLAEVDHQRQCCRRALLQERWDICRQWWNALHYLRRTYTAASGAYLHMDEIISYSSDICALWCVVMVQNFSGTHFPGLCVAASLLRIFHDAPMFFCLLILTSSHGWIAASHGWIVDIPEASAVVSMHHRWAYLTF
jgi:hypothetical protein